MVGLIKIKNNGRIVINDNLWRLYFSGASLLYER